MGGRGVLGLIGLLEVAVCRTCRKLITVLFAWVPRAVVRTTRREAEGAIMR